MRRVQLGAGAEFRRIEALVDAAGAPSPGPEVLLGPGDDAAALRAQPGESILTSCDLSIEGVHFRREWLTWDEIGWRAAASALSDLAAMAARPLGALVSLAVPPETDERTLRELATGFGALLRAAEAPLLGGDLSRSPGPVVLDVVVLGAAASPLTRAGAQEGDELWVTGRLGGAALATVSWESGLEPDPAARSSFVHPHPRIREMLWLRERVDLHAGIDLSDGLVGDAGHVAAASGVGLELEARLIPLHDALEAFTDRSSAEAIALAGGEDYEILLAAPAGALQTVREEFRVRFDVPLTRVGRVVGGREVSVTGPEGRPLTGDLRSFDHFGS